MFDDLDRDFSSASGGDLGGGDRGRRQDFGDRIFFCRKVLNVSPSAAGL